MDMLQNKLIQNYLWSLKRLSSNLVKFEVKLCFKTFWQWLRKHWDIEKALCSYMDDFFGKISNPDSIVEKTET